LVLKLLSFVAVSLMKRGSGCFIKNKLWLRLRYVGYTSNQISQANGIGLEVVDVLLDFFLKTIS
jgi:hypothetical protein